MADCLLVGAGTEEVRGPKSYFAVDRPVAVAPYGTARICPQCPITSGFAARAATCLHPAFAARWRITMRVARAYRPAPEICVRPAQPDDLVALLGLEDRAFTTDRMSRRSMRRFLSSPHAQVNVAELDRD